MKTVVKEINHIGRIILLCSAVILGGSSALLSQDLSLGFIGNQNDISELTNEEHAAYTWANERYNVKFLTATEIKNGSIQSSDFDVLWWHLDEPNISAGWTGKGGEVYWNSQFSESETVENILQYIYGGGGLFLSGLAPSYVINLGLQSDGSETNRGFNIQKSDSSGTFLDENEWGFQLKQPNHPIFKGIASDYDDIFFTLGGNVTINNLLSWWWPPEQEHFDGRRLAAPEWDGGNISTGEYNYGLGSVIFVGTGAFSWNYKNDSTNVHRQVLEQYTDNIIHYLDRFSYEYAKTDIEIGFLGLPSNTEGLNSDEKRAFEWAKKIYQEKVDYISIEDIQNQSAEIADYNVLWWHWDNAEFDSSGVIFPDSVSSRFVTRRFRSFLANGGGIFLSGFAAGYSVELGLQEQRPEQVDTSDVFLGSTAGDSDDWGFDDRWGYSLTENAISNAIFEDLNNPFYTLSGGIEVNNRRSVWTSGDSFTGKKLTDYHWAENGTNDILSGEFILGDGSVLVDGSGNYQWSYGNAGDGVNFYIRNLGKYTVNIVKYLDQEISLPKIAIPDTSNISFSRATLSSQVYNNSGSEVTERGFVISKASINSRPVIGGEGVTSIKSGIGIGVFTDTISKLEPNSTYYVKSYAINGSGTRYSLRVEFTTESAQKVSLISPENQANQVSVETSLDWEGIEDYKNYQVQISESLAFQESVLDTTLAGLSLNLSDIVKKGKQYFWRVRFTTEMEQGPWSDIWSFETNIRVPGKVILASPADGEEAVSTNPIFKWEKSDRAENYHFVLSENEEFSQSKLDTLLSDTSFSALKKLKANTIYYWQVSANNISGNGTWSDTWSFTTSKQSVSIVKLYYPKDGDNNVEKAPEFLWSSVSNSDGYRFQISEDSSFSSVVVDSSSIADTTLKLNDKLLDFGTEYWWRVRSNIEENTGDWSNTAVFKIRLEKPGKVALLSPDNGSDNVQLDVSFSWEQNHLASAYRMQLSQTDEFNTTLSDTVVSTNKVAFIEALTSAETYFWRVKAMNEDLNGDWSDTWSFETSMSTSLEDEKPLKFALHQNYPNPFNPKTQIKYSVPKTSTVRLEVFNLLGQSVEVLVHDRQSGGNYMVNFDAVNLSSGVYIYRLQTDSESITKQMVILK